VIRPDRREAIAERPHRGRIEIGDAETVENTCIRWRVVGISEHAPHLIVGAPVVAIVPTLERIAAEWI
jgi:hypothetical protein